MALYLDPYIAPIAITLAFYSFHICVIILIMMKIRERKRRELSIKSLKYKLNLLYLLLVIPLTLLLILLSLAFHFYFYYWGLPIFVFLVFLMVFVLLYCGNKYLLDDLTTKEKKGRRMALSVFSLMIAALYLVVGFLGFFYFLNVMLYYELILAPFICVLLILFGIISLIQAKRDISKKILGRVSILTGIISIGIYTILFFTWIPQFINFILAILENYSMEYFLLKLIEVPLTFLPMIIFGVWLICHGLDLIEKIKIRERIKVGMGILSSILIIISLLMTIPFYGELLISLTVFNWYISIPLISAVIISAIVVSKHRKRVKSKNDN